VAAYLMLAAFAVMGLVFMAFFRAPERRTR
jgi:hypothetical protein